MSEILELTNNELELLAEPNSEIMLTKSDLDLIVLASSSASLAKVPGKNNWIEHANGNLPPYVRKIARGIMKSGKTLSAAIGIAISRIKKWARGGDGVNADTVAKSIKALAQWEALKAKNKAKKVKLSREDGSEYILLSSVDDVSLDQVRDAWGRAQNSLRDQVRQAAHLSENSYAEAERAVPYSYVREVYLDYIIVDVEVNDSNKPQFAKVPYTITDGGVVFSAPTEIELMYVDPSSDWKVTARK